MLIVEQLPDRLLPSALFTEVNDQWQSLAMGRTGQPPLTENALLDGYAAQWALEANGLGGDMRDIGPQNEIINGWWIGAEIQTAIPPLVAGRGLIHGGPLQAGVGQSGGYYALVTGIPASEAGAMPAASKGTML